MSADVLKIMEESRNPYCSLATDKYEILSKIGRGTFGEVYRGRMKTDISCHVAMKKILMENEHEGFPLTALREIKILQQLEHKNVVQLQEICSSEARAHNRYKSSFYLIFEFCQHDLAGLLKHPGLHFRLEDRKNILYQLLSGVFYVHGNNILHRDLKAANILVTKDGVVKLADFGLARPFSSSSSSSSGRSGKRAHTNKVVTLWYRPPEVLLGERSYGTEIDMWGVGCIMAELWTRTPILQGDTEQGQLGKIVELCGSISEEVWPGVTRYRLFREVELPQGRPRQVRKKLLPVMQDREAVDLFDRFLSLDPAQRISANSALNHTFFWVKPLPSPSLAPLLVGLPPLHDLATSRGQHRRGGGFAPSQQSRYASQQQQQQQQSKHAASRPVPYPARRPEPSSSQLCDTIF